MTKYVVDTSSLINLTRHYPRKAFSGLWKNIEALVEEGSMVAPLRVYKEIERKNDEIFEWSQAHKFMFKKEVDDVEKAAAKLIKKYKSMSSRDTSIEKADPYVIALAHYIATNTLAEKPVVVTEEGTRRNQIPQIARSHGLRYLGLAGMILEEEWSFE